jgi:hypothetical protein
MPLSGFEPTAPDSQFHTVLGNQLHYINKYKDQHAVAYQVMLLCCAYVGEVMSIVS